MAVTLSGFRQFVMLDLTRLHTGNFNFANLLNKLTFLLVTIPSEGWHNSKNNNVVRVR